MALPSTLVAERPMSRKWSMPSSSRMPASGMWNWEIIPRYDKLLPETEYRLGERGFSRDKAQRYLNACGKDLDTLESQLNLALPRMIEQYLARD